MKISDRVDNKVVANVHPLVASTVLNLCGGDKCRLEWVNPFTVIVHSSNRPFTWHFDEDYRHNPSYNCPGPGIKCVCWDIDNL